MSPMPDPLQLWRKALTTLEGRGNTVANKAMGTGDLASALHQVANASLGMQQTFEKVLGTYLRKLDLPSRKEIAELTAAVQRVEARLDALAGAASKPSDVPHPPRTRRPAPEGAAVPALPTSKTTTPARPRTSSKAAAPVRSAAAKRPSGKRAVRKP
ncbi:MAG: hypothetical protein ABWZ88_19615 [Variovorax sp.]